MYFDTHAHLDDIQFRQDRHEVIDRAHKAGVGLILNIGCSLPSAQRTLALTRQYDFIYGAVGIHPHEAKDLDGEGLREIKRIAGEPKIMAIGEIGLDYYRNHSPQDVQQRTFRRMIYLARELNKPIVIHDRDAHEDVFKILKEESAHEVGGIFHCYSGSWPLAFQAIEMGFYLSIAGPVTYHKNRKTVEVVEKVPLEHLLIETDSPYLAPVPYRGKRNESSYVGKVAERIAEIKGVPLPDVARITFSNGKKILGITGKEIAG